MPIIKWRPFLEQFEDMDKAFANLPEKISSFMPAVDVYQTKDKVIVEAPLAGVDPEKVDISIENDILIISGSSEKKTEVEEKDYYRKEVNHGSFYRSIPLPAHVLGDKATATSSEGVIKIEIPKAPETKGKKVKIKIKK